MQQSAAMHATPLQTTARLDDTTESERTYTMFIHLAGMLSMLDFTILGAIASGIMWKIRKDDSAFIDDHGREALNFQLSLLVYSLAAFVLIVATLGVAGLLVGPLAIALWIVRLVAGIRGAIAANRGQRYRYPICIRFIPDAA